MTPEKIVYDLPFVSYRGYLNPDDTDTHRVKKNAWNCYPYLLSDISKQ